MNWTNEDKSKRDIMHRLDFVRDGIDFTLRVSEGEDIFFWMNLKKVGEDKPKMEMTFHYASSVEEAKATLDKCVPIMEAAFRAMGDVIERGQA